MKKRILLLSLLGLFSVVSASSIPDGFKSWVYTQAPNASESDITKYWNTAATKAAYLTEAGSQEEASRPADYDDDTFDDDGSTAASGDLNDRTQDFDEEGSTATGATATGAADVDAAAVTKTDSRMTEAAQLMADINAENPGVWEAGVKDKLVSALQENKAMASAKRSRRMGRLGKRKAKMSSSKRKAKSNKLSAKQKKRKAHLKSTKKGHNKKMANKMKSKSKKAKVNRKKAAPKKASSGRYKS